jgi:hypothetical protein
LAVLVDSKEATFLGASLMAALGFAYCYVASAPILTLHATRAHLRLSTLKSRPWWTIVCTGLSLTIATWIASQVLPVPAALAAGTAVGFQIALVLLAVFSKFSVVEAFYRQLAIVRAESMSKREGQQSAGVEYVTSYRHLREHGNAFLILIFEGILAYVLLHLTSATCAFYLLAAWLLPAASVWVLGTVLECRLVSTPLPQSGHTQDGQHAAQLPRQMSLKDTAEQAEPSA